MKILKFITATTTVAVAVIALLLLTLINYLNETKGVNPYV